MAEKLSFDKLPAAVAKILEILASEESGHTALPELVQRMALLEKKIDNIERLLSPDRPVMDKQTVLKVLKMKPKALYEVEAAGVLTSHKEGRSTVFYEDDVVRFHMKHGWRALADAASKPVPAEPLSAKSAPANTVPDEPVAANDGRLIDMDAAVALLGRTKFTVYKLTSQKKIPFIRSGNKVYFEVETLNRWMAANPARKRRKRHETETA